MCQSPASRKQAQAQGYLNSKSAQCLPMNCLHSPSGSSELLPCPSPTQPFPLKMSFPEAGTMCHLMPSPPHRPSPQHWCERLHRPDRAQAEPGTGVTQQASPGRGRWGDHYFQTGDEHRHRTHRALTMHGNLRFSKVLLGRPGGFSLCFLSNPQPLPPPC